MLKSPALWTSASWKIQIMGASQATRTIEFGGYRPRHAGARRNTSRSPVLRSNGHAEFAHAGYLCGIIQLHASHVLCKAYRSRRSLVARNARALRAAAAARGAANLAAFKSSGCITHSGPGRLHRSLVRKSDKY